MTLKNGVFTLFHSTTNTDVIMQIFNILRDFSLTVFIDGAYHDDNFFTTHYKDTESFFIGLEAGKLVPLELYDRNCIIVIHIDSWDTADGYFEKALNWLQNNMQGIFDASIKELFTTRDDIEENWTEGPPPSNLFKPPGQELYTYRSLGNKYEICQPNTDRPYTTIADDMVDMFTNLFACSSFGSPADVTFLSKIWEECGLEGEFDMNALLKKRIDRIAADPEDYPRVYRKKLEDV